MKKMMIAVCAIAMAAVAQAGMINWSLMNLSASTAAGFTDKTTYTAYLFVGNADDLATAKSYLTGDTKNLSAFADMAATSRTATYADEVMSFYQEGYGSYVSQTVSAFAIVLDSDDINKAQNYLVAENSAGNNVISQTFKTTGNKTYAWGDQSEIAWNTMAAPEPTSGLLLLIGMAGLALKRKRA